MATGSRSWTRSGPPATRSGGQRTAAPRQRVRPPARLRPAKAGSSRRCEASSGCGGTAQAGSVDRQGNGVPAARQYRRHRWANLSEAAPCGLRPASERTPCLTGDAPAAEPPRAPLTAWLRAADRPRGQPVHRPDLPLRLDHGWQLPAAPGRRVQQSGRHAGPCRPGRAPSSTPGRAEAGALTVTHPARHHGHRRWNDLPALFDVLPQLGPRREGGRSGQGRAGDRPRRQHRPRDQRSPPSGAQPRHPPTRSAPSWIRPSDSRPTPPTPSSGSSRSRAPASSRVRSSTPTGTPVPQARIYGMVKPEPAETPFSFAETYGDKGTPIRSTASTSR